MEFLQPFMRLQPEMRGEKCAISENLSQHFGVEIIAGFSPRISGLCNCTGYIIRKILSAMRGNKPAKKVSQQMDKKPLLSETTKVIERLDNEKYSNRRLRCQFCQKAFLVNMEREFSDDIGAFVCRTCFTVLLCIAGRIHDCGKVRLYETMEKSTYGFIIKFAEPKV